MLFFDHPLPSQRQKLIGTEVIGNIYPYTVDELGGRQEEDPLDGKIAVDSRGDAPNPQVRPTRTTFSA
ncbi:hypothetical protein ACFY8V_22320 [Streptomyces californicus]|uniref:hypothetical protein n=1 Tax=Streptomyces TaxID=1883 RepID=UPI0011851BC4|nr:hypothetical protein [Streptomyces sp. sk226]